MVYTVLILRPSIYPSPLSLVSSDNELSPECLDACNSFLKADGISIPSSYTSLVAPVQSTKLHQNVRSYREDDKAFDAGFETPYVANLHNCLRLTPAQPLFTFRHPNWNRTSSSCSSKSTSSSSSKYSSSSSSSSESNERFETVTFRLPESAVDATVDGFCGYFHADLYGKYFISIVPEDHTQGMFSWFPFYLPIRSPIHLKPGAELTACFWRRVREEKSVWYEWAILEPVPSIIHNSGGAASAIGL